MGKIWKKEEVHFDVSGRPFKVKAGLFEQLRSDRERISRITGSGSIENRSADFHQREEE